MVFKPVVIKVKRKDRVLYQYLFGGMCSYVTWNRLSSNLPKMPAKPSSRLFLKEHMASWESLFQGAEQYSRRLISDFTVERAFVLMQYSIYSQILLWHV